MIPAHLPSTRWGLAVSEGLALSALLVYLAFVVIFG